MNEWWSSPVNVSNFKSRAKDKLFKERYGLPGPVRLVGLNMLGAALGNGENSRLFIGRACRCEGFASVVRWNGQIVFAVQD